MEDLPTLAQSYRRSLMTFPATHSTGRRIHLCADANDARLFLKRRERALFQTARRQDSKQTQLPRNRYDTPASIESRLIAPNTRHASLSSLSLSLVFPKRRRYIKREEARRSRTMTRRSSVAAQETTPKTPLIRNNAIDTRPTTLAPSSLDTVSRSALTAFSRLLSASFHMSCRSIKMVDLNLDAQSKHR